MLLVDHTDKEWLSKWRRVNGAYTYSLDLVKYQIPKWSKILGENDIISTCPRFDDVNVTGKFRWAVQYLHSYPYHNPLKVPTGITRGAKFSAEKFIFVSAYKEFVKILTKAGFNAFYAPMGVDVEAIRAHDMGLKGPETGIVYFGNVVHNKLGLFNVLKNETRMRGLKMDVVSNGTFNGKPIEREQALELISTYDYGIGVGRCAQEMMALGLKTVIAGVKVGGIITNEAEYEEQLGTNMNGRLYTYSNRPNVCLRNLDKAAPRAHDIVADDHAARFLTAN